MKKKIDYDPKYESIVQNESGLMIVGRQDFYQGKTWLRTITWSRHLDGKTLDDVNLK